jgi:hypothetical protein
MKSLKKEIQNLKDSNENHIFINEKLNQALKKSSGRVEELERALEIERSKNDSIKSNPGMGMGHSTAESQEPQIVVTAH